MKGFIAGMTIGVLGLYSFMATCAYLGYYKEEKARTEHCDRKKKVMKDKGYEWVSNK